MEPVNKQVGTTPVPHTPVPGPHTSSSIPPAPGYLSNKSPSGTKKLRNFNNSPFNQPDFRAKYSRSGFKTLSIDQIPIILSLADTGTYCSTARQLSIHQQTVKNTRLMVENYYTKPIFTNHTEILPTSPKSSRLRPRPHNPTYIPNKTFNRLILTDFGKSILPVLRQIHELNMGIWHEIIQSSNR